MKAKIVNQGGINGLGEGIVNINSKDFKALQSVIQERNKSLTPEEKLSNSLLSIRFQMESYLEREETTIKAIGWFIKSLIKELGIKNRDLATYLDYEESNLSSFLNGRRKLNTDLAMKLGRVFKLSPKLLLNIQVYNELKAFEEINNNKYLNYNIDDLLLTFR